MADGDNMVVGTQNDAHSGTSLVVELGDEVGKWPGRSSLRSSRYWSADRRRTRITQRSRPLLQPARASLATAALIRA